jgi:hypothetical protein
MFLWRVINVLTMNPVYMPIEFIYNFIVYLLYYLQRN